MEILPDELKALRESLGLTAAMAAGSVRVALRTWQCYEAAIIAPSYRAIPALRLELFCNKHGLPYPPTRRDGTMSDQTSHVITLLSGTGGSGKTSIALEVGRVFASNGKIVKVISDAPGLTSSRFCFENPEIVAEQNVLLTKNEVKDLRAKLINKGIIDPDGSCPLSGADLFMAGGDLQRLRAKSDAHHSLEHFRKTADIIILDDAISTDLALAISDIIVFVFDSSHWAAYTAAETAFRTALDRNKEISGLPQLRALLVNVSSAPDEDRGIHAKVAHFGLPILHTVLSNAHQIERQKVGHALLRNEQFKLLVDAAPESLSAYEYHSLAREIERDLGRISRPTPPTTTFIHGRLVAFPTPEEDARITAGALADPDNPPLTDSDFSQLRPAKSPRHN